MTRRKIIEFLKKETTNKNNRFIYLLTFLLIHPFVYSSTYLLIYLIFFLFTFYRHFVLIYLSCYLHILFTNLFVLIGKFKFNYMFIIRAFLVNCNLASKLLFLGEKCCFDIKWLEFTHTNIRDIPILEPVKYL